jgi:hypothetical protein
MQKVKGPSEYGRSPFKFRLDPLEHYRSSVNELLQQVRRKREPLWPDVQHRRQALVDSSASRVFAGVAATFDAPAFFRDVGGNEFGGFEGAFGGCGG